MKNFLQIFFVFLCVFLGAQQKKFVLTDIQTKKEFVKKDSLSAVKFLDSLAENNYYFTTVAAVSQEGKITKISFDKGKNYNEGFVKVRDSIAQNLKTKPEFFSKNIDSLKQQISQKYAREGYSFNRVRTKYLGSKNGVPTVEISVEPRGQRTIDGFVLKGYDRAPKRFVKNIEKDFRGKPYSEKNIEAIRQSLQNHAFVTLDQPPQTLFTRDSTNIYLFLQKKKASTFDGVVGFGNDKSEKFTFNGSLNVSFKNLFNGFESVNIFWQRNPDKGQTFDLGADVPYLFGSNAGLNFNANIYRQDSTFATVKLLPSVYWHFSSRQKLGLRGHFESSSVTAENYSKGQDFSKSGAGIWYEFLEPAENPLLIYRTKIRAEADFLKAKYDAENTTATQFHYYALAERNFNLKGNHWLNLKAETAMLDAENTFSANELLRFGGWNSFRGFNENTLLADLYYYGNLEYRYLIGQQAFFDIFGQYGGLNNKLLNVHPKLYSFGLGFNFFLPIGLMTFQISNGSEFGNAIRFNDTKIHWGILTRF